MFVVLLLFFLVPTFFLVLCLQVFLILHVSGVFSPPYMCCEQSNSCNYYLGFSINFQMEINKCVFMYIYICIHSHALQIHK